MNLFDATILGIIEGITEFLPVSSTAHLILGAKILNLEQTDFVKSFEIIIQLGAILAVVTLYFKSFFNIEILKKLVAGFLPTAIIGLLVYKRVKEYLGDISIVLWALFIGGILLIIFELFNKRKVEKGVDSISIKQSVIIGLCQCVAFIPGVSRSAATIVGGMMQGISRTAIAEFSFLLAVPTMCAATGLDIIKNKDALIHGGNLGALVVGFVISYVVAIIAIKGFLSFVKKHDFIVFGVYRILIAIIFYLFVI
ncbi:MAG: Undecaprenyl-diphosphatase [Candidatus Taylorbacteria bacterium]|nr:Undecaprenyl-diphosphatase [Candidatus Taylorbacteria bacterium]